MTSKPRRPPVKVKVPALSTVRPAALDLDVDNLTLQGKALSARLRNALTEGSIETTIEGASTLSLTVADWNEGLLHSKLIQGAVTLVFDGIELVLVKYARAGDAMTLTFEERAVNLLRQYSKPKTANRASTTRAQFVRSMVTEVREARIPFQCPEVNVRQPIAPVKSRARL